MILVILFLAFAKIFPVDADKNGCCEPTMLYTYHEGNLGGIEGTRRMLLKLWLRNWSFHGYAGQLHLLTLPAAERHSRFNEARKHFCSLPTVNDKEYELNCYLRWLAFEQTFQDGDTGIKTFLDYDIYWFGPQMTAERPFDRVLGESFNLTSYQQNLPMIVHASRAGAAGLAKYLQSYKYKPEKDTFENRPHLSDMSILRQAANIITAENESSVVNDQLFDRVLPEWPSIIHFSYHASQMWSKSAVILKEKLQTVFGVPPLQRSSEVDWIRAYWPSQLLSAAFVLNHPVHIVIPEGLEGAESAALFADLFRLRNVNFEDDQLWDAFVPHPYRDEKECFSGRKVQISVGTEILSDDKVFQFVLFCPTSLSPSNLNISEVNLPKRLVPLNMKKLSASLLVLEYATGFVHIQAARALHQLMLQGRFDLTAIPSKSADALNERFEAFSMVAAKTEAMLDFVKRKGGQRPRR